MLGEVGPERHDARGDASVRVGVALPRPGVDAEPGERRSEHEVQLCKQAHGDSSNRRETSRRKVRPGVLLCYPV